MKAKNQWTLTAMLTISLSAGLATSGLAELNNEQKSLVNIEKMAVEVRCNEDFPKVAGPNQQDIAGNISRQLRSAGIEVIHKYDSFKVPGQPCLDLIIKGYKPPNQQIYICNLALRLNQKTALARNPKIQVKATTWELTWLADEGGQRIAKAIQTKARIMVDSFIRDYLTANTKSVRPADANDITTVPKEQVKPVTKPAVAEYKYVASKNSKVFHKSDCVWVQRIAPKNMVYYKTRDEAVNDGKRPCKTCKP